jgi:predicted nucleic acid-binding protein
MATAIRYLDTSFLTPLFVPEATSGAISEYVKSFADGTLATSHWTRVEFGSVLARLRRMNLLTGRQTDEAEAMFERTLSRLFKLLPTEVVDHEAAMGLLRTRSTSLRAADALHLAVARNHGAAAVLTLDKTLITEGRRLGLDIGPGIELEGYDGLQS